MSGEGGEVGHLPGQQAGVLQVEPAELRRGGEWEGRVGLELARDDGPQPHLQRLALALRQPLQQQRHGGRRLRHEATCPPAGSAITVGMVGTMTAHRHTALEIGTNSLLKRRTLLLKFSW